MVLADDLQMAGELTAKTALGADLRADLRSDMLETAARLYTMSTWVSAEED